ncbi:MAG: tripartite tricarboxylate transporter substrate binding protein [Burkholderiales bacterium]|nr:tripartite tricarboxylate transporter substrate binding protein [Burkholderiales bacterium]
MRPNSRRTAGLAARFAAARAAAFAAGILLAAATAGQAQEFPAKPVRVITPFAAGNTLDQALRIVSDRIKDAGGQPLVIDNKPGGAGFIAAQAGAQAAPDGYTLLLAGSGMMVINPHTFSKLPYDPEKSYRPVTNFLGTALVLAAHPSLPANTLAELVAHARTNPGKVSFASFTAGNSSHFAGVLFNRRAGIDMLHVPFNGTPPAVQNLVGGQVNTAFLPLLAVKPHVDAGRVKLLAVTSDRRTPLAPAVPTFEESGYPDLTIFTWAALLAPAGTPDALIGRLNAEFTRALRSDEVRDKFRAMDFVPMPTTPEEFSAYMRRDSLRWQEAVRLSGFKASE